MLNHPLHAAAYSLNSKCQYRHNIGDNSDLLKAVHIVYTQLDPGAANELIYFKDGKKSFGDRVAMAARSKMQPEEVFVDRGVTVSSSSDDQHTSDGIVEEKMMEMIEIKEEVGILVQEVGMLVRQVGMLMEVIFIKIVVDKMEEQVKLVKIL
ncbi:hypothetical protein Dsin_001859 [Dipteronia sinensis]|uniref:Uncharacterized protein n=1 Tax=Dipteronia sinensis TaxID=43782 RepID=A0AAE0B4S0_9ROSI|nr:hypothetical protein Dsin_001859 [Dipteronia sinensis]